MNTPLFPPPKELARLYDLAHVSDKHGASIYMDTEAVPSGALWLVVGGADCADYRWVYGDGSCLSPESCLSLDQSITGISSELSDYIRALHLLLFP